MAALPALLAQALRRSHFPTLLTGESGGRTSIAFSAADFCDDLELLGKDTIPPGSVEGAIGEAGGKTSEGLETGQGLQTVGV
jgi:hypothetical protein